MNVARALRWFSNFREFQGVSNFCPTFACSFLVASFSVLIPCYTAKNWNTTLPGNVPGEKAWGTFPETGIIASMNNSARTRTQTCQIQYNNLLNK